MKSMLRSSLSLAMAATVLGSLGLTACGSKDSGGGAPPANTQNLNAQNQFANQLNQQGVGTVNGLSTDIVQGRIINRTFNLVFGIAQHKTVNNTCPLKDTLPDNLVVVDDGGIDNYSLKYNLKGNGVNMTLAFDGNGVLTVTVVDASGTKTSSPILPAVALNTPANNTNTANGNANQQVNRPATYFLDGDTQQLRVGQFAAAGALSDLYRNKILAEGGAFRRMAQNQGNLSAPSLDGISMVSNGRFDPNYQPGQPILPTSNQQNLFATPQGNIGSVNSPNTSQVIFDTLVATVINTPIQNKQHVLGLKSDYIHATSEYLAAAVSTSSESCMIDYDFNMEKMIFQ